MLKKVHHINLLVKDLASAILTYQQAFALDAIEYGELDGRGVKTARFKAGETWIVLIEPTNPDGVPGRHLDEHGEGLFMLSFEVDNLNSAAAQIDTAVSGLADTPQRTGLQGWQVRDLAPTTFHGAVLQLTEENDD
ncbi:hypothetical protein A3709_05320 [Halioglobus sp. HI00S01]|uniref:VOC family protein n=1 Tax=Halioglobus sp. HI00S01 TaxID=1822214 RepID=UPI0007C37755|nr:VOC family protein [Halioglobus sp. HI00S01]KZX56523.1 hypothetical protein A3709_05320 [Halioglobus sp. HI00S01]